MSKVWPSQAYKAAFISAMRAAEAYRDQEREKADARRNKVKYANASGHVFRRTRSEKRIATLEKAIEAMQEASKL